MWKHPPQCLDKVNRYWWSLSHSSHPIKPLAHRSNLRNKRCGPKPTRLALLTPKCFNPIPLCISCVLAGCFGANVCVWWANRPCFFVLIWEMWTQCARRDFRLAHDQNEIWLERHPQLHYHELSYLLSIKCSQQSVNGLFFHISTQLFWMRSWRFGPYFFTFHRLNQDGHFTPSRDICMSFTPSPCSSRRSPPCLLLFHLACLVFPPTVLQHDGSIWKCLLKGSGEWCSRGPCWLWILNTGTHTVVPTHKETTASMLQKVLM